MKKLLAILLSLAMTLSVTAALAEGETIVVGTNAEFHPFEFIDDTGAMAGFDIDLINAIGEKLGVTIKMEDMYFDGLLGALDTGVIDVVIAAMTITEENNQTGLFTVPYYDAKQAVLVREGYEGIKTLEDIADKKVCAQDGTTGFFMATDKLGCPAANVAGFKSTTDALLELLNGRADALIIDNAVAASFCNLYEGVVAVEGLEMPPEQYGIAVKDDALREKINAALEEILASELYTELVDKYTK